MRWEYHVVIRTRLIRHATLGTRAAAEVVSDFNPNGEAMLGLLAELGEQEWELVGISTRTSVDNSPMTSEELWVFKRPKP